MKELEKKLKALQILTYSNGVILKIRTMKETKFRIQHGYGSVSSKVLGFYMVLTGNIHLAK